MMTVAEILQFCALSGIDLRFRRFDPSNPYPDPDSVVDTLRLPVFTEIIFSVPAKSGRASWHTVVTEETLRDAGGFEASVAVAFAEFCKHARLAPPPMLWGRPIVTVETGGDPDCLECSYSRPGVKHKLCDKCSVAGIVKPPRSRFAPVPESELEDAIPQRRSVKGEEEEGYPSYKDGGMPLG